MRSSRSAGCCGGWFPTGCACRTCGLLCLDLTKPLPNTADPGHSMSGFAAGGAQDPSMTPFGERVRRLRRERGLLLKDMAAHLGVSSAYLSALERGERGKPTW